MTSKSRKRIALKCIYEYLWESQVSSVSLLGLDAKILTISLNMAAMSSAAKSSDSKASGTKSPNFTSPNLGAAVGGEVRWVVQIPLVESFGFTKQRDIPKVLGNS